MLPLPIRRACFLPGAGYSCWLTCPFACCSLQKQSPRLCPGAGVLLQSWRFTRMQPDGMLGTEGGRHVCLSLNVQWFEKIKQICIRAGRILGSFDCLLLPLIFKRNILISPKPDLVKLATFMLNLLQIKRPSFTRVWISTHLKLCHGKWCN